MAEITAGVLLSLKDQLSSKIKSAGVSVSGFGEKAVGVANKVDNAFKGLAGTLGTIGVSIGVAATFKSLMDLDNRMARVGLTANASAKQVNELKRKIFDAAKMPDIKINPDSIIGGLEVVMTKTGDLKYAEENIRNIGLAIQASGESGDAIGSVFAEFQKFGYTAEQISRLMDDMVAQSDQGAFTFAEFAKAAPAVFSAYSAIGTSPENIRKANAAMQILVAGTKSPEIAVTALNSAMMELSDPEKQKKLRALGIAVRDSSGKFRDFNDIMFDVVAKANKLGNADIFGTVFGTTSMQAVRSYMTQGERMYAGLVNLGDTTGLLQRKSAVMANTLKSSFQNLQTVFMSLADEKVSGPMQGLVDFMNYLSEDTSRIESGIKAIAGAFAALAAVRMSAGIVSFVANLKGLKGGGIDISGLTKTTGGAGMPVYVTNMGMGGVPSSGVPGVGGNYKSTGVPMLGVEANKAANAANFAKGARSAGVIAVATTGITSGIQAYQQNKAIDANTEMTEREKSKAKGGNTGEAIGKTVGTGAGVIGGALLAGKVGAAIGTAITPGIGTAIGGAIGLAGGALVGWLGGKAGKKAGEAIGDAVGFRKEQEALRNAAAEPAGIPRSAAVGIAAPEPEIEQPKKRTLVSTDGWNFAEVPPAVREEVRTVTAAPAAAAPVKIDGEIQLRSILEVRDDSMRLQQSIERNTTPYKFPAGNAPEVRRHN